MDCPECGQEMEQIDTTFSTYNSPNFAKNEHSGNIWQCKNENCEDDTHWLESFIPDSPELQVMQY